MERERGERRGGRGNGREKPEEERWKEHQGIHTLEVEGKREDGGIGIYQN